jgi:hypothetical protein
MAKHDKDKDSLTAQGRMHGAINKQLEHTKKLLRDQAVLQETINQVLKDGIDAASGAGSKVDAFLKAQGVSMSKSFADREKAVKDLAKKASKDAKAAIEGDAGAVGSAFEIISGGIGGMSGELKDFLTATGTGLDEADALMMKYSGDYVSRMAQLQRDLGGTYVGTADDTNKVVGQLQENLIKGTVRFHKMNVDGTNIAYKSIFKNFDDYYGHIDAIAGRGTVAYQVFEDLNADQLDQAKLLATGLDMTDKELADSLINQMSMTGEASLDMLSETAAMSKALSKTTQLSSKDIGKQMQGIINDTYRFANVTRTQAGKLSVALIKAGIDYKDMSRIVGQFQTFDQAADKVAKLTSTFGGNMDAMEMMNLSLNDQPKFLMKIQEWWKSTGRDIRTEGTAAKQMLADMIPAGDIPAVMRLLESGDPAEAEKIAATIAEAKEAAKDPKSVIASLEGDLKRTLETGKSLSETMGDDFVKAMGAQFIPTVGRVAVEVRKLSKEMPVKGAQALTDMLKTMSGISDSSFKDMGSGLDLMVESLSQFIGKLGQLDIKGAVEGPLEDLKKLAEPMADLMVGMFTQMKDDLKPIFKELGESLGEGLKAFMVKSSPLPAAQLAIMQHFITMGKLSAEGVNKAFEPKNFSSLAEFQTALGEAVAGQEVQDELKQFVNFNKGQLDELSAYAEEYKVGSILPSDMGGSLITSKTGHMAAESATDKAFNALMSKTAMMDLGDLQKQLDTMDPAIMADVLEQMDDALADLGADFSASFQSGMASDAAGLQEAAAEILKLQDQGPKIPAPTWSELGLDDMDPIVTIDPADLPDPTNELDVLNQWWQDSGIAEIAGFDPTVALDKILERPEAEPIYIEPQPELKTDTTTTSGHVEALTGALHGLEKSLDRATLTGATQQDRKTYLTVDLVLGNDKLRILKEKLLNSGPTTSGDDIVRR